MKIKNILWIIPLITLSAFSNDINSIKNFEKKQEFNEKTKQYNKKRFNYVLIGPSSREQTYDTLVPSIAAGRRYEIDESAIDISCGFSFFSNSKKDFLQFYLPKIAYIKYLNNSPYYCGAGLSYLTQYNDDSKSYSNFSGIAAHLSTGAEFGRHERIRQIVQLELSQPTIPAYKSGSKFPKPTLQVSAGIGF